MSVKVNQKAYLKKYLSKDKKKKKDKKEKISQNIRVKIIDDDIDVHKGKPDDDDILILTGEDAPQIVGIIDDRPPELKTVEDFRNSGKWRSIDKNEDDGIGSLEFQKRSNIYSFNKKQEKTLSPENTDSSLRRKEINIDADLSPVRRRTLSNDDFSPSRRKKGDSGDDLSPPRRKKFSADDFSPPRRKKGSSGDDISPPRRKKVSADDIAPSRRKICSSDDLSPPRRKKVRGTSVLSSDKHTKATNADSKKGNISRFSEHGNCEVDLSPKSHNKEKSNKHNRDYTSPKIQTSSNDYFSNKEARKEGTKTSGYKDSEVWRNPQKEIIAQPHKLHFQERKKTGLQDAKMLSEESKEFRRREDELFKEMSNEVSGKNADVTVRNKKSVKTEEEKAKEEEKYLREQEKYNAYSRWGVGLKQIENYKNKVVDEMLEISKPLARYSDDPDLDEMLRKQERDGDPMLAYIKERKKEELKKSGDFSVPKYQGPFPENRFNIRPGYRWDGVDRSNGYEKKWFDIQNQKIAMQEEAYKYSIEDM